MTSNTNAPRTRGTAIEESTDILCTLALIAANTDPEHPAAGRLTAVLDAAGDAIADIPGIITAHPDVLRGELTGGDGPAAKEYMSGLVERAIERSATAARARAVEALAGLTGTGGQQ
ncbi:hypothetical protein [Arsenicicoccus dermatophilus]|uniref:hypothetical protein n=1 Tax=Arsenicicoccus dermatophilus TaxID=1076331 RepID=UPI001F4C6F18|nr:hypothetical protein [Arsenicicoccus dermatophilus]MCH8613449.1 hypothetical protein [Arsenicicoccus dermatophilus]